jgi:tetratricopeptide (TPR) repeat protein
VAEAAGKLAADARASGDAATRSRALALLGRARRSLGEIDLAEADLVGALAAAGEAGDDDLAADAHVGLAGVLSFQGRNAEAFAHLDTADRLGSDRVRAYAALQRAAISQRIGHMREAVAGYESALPTLRRLDARLDIALVLMNRGVIRIQSGECDGAIADLTEAGRLFEGEGHDFGFAQTRHGLGWAHARRGDLPGALRYLDQATERFKELGHDAVEVEVERIEALLAAGLFAEAAELAVDTARRLGAAGNHSWAAETWLLCAQADLLGGDRAAAAAHAGRARALFAEQGSTGWERAARLEVLRAGPAPGGAGELRALADELDLAGNARGAATAVALAALAACDAGDVGRAEALAAECARRARGLGVFEVRMLATQATATCAVARGDLARARRHVRAGLDELRRHRASFAATEASASVAAHAAQLAALGLRLAVRTGSAAVVLDWMELARAGRAGQLRPRPPDDEALAADLTELRSVAAGLRAAESEGRDTADLLRQRRDLERGIHRRRLRGDGAGGDGGAGLGPAPTLGELTALLRGGSLVELAEVDGRLVGVRVGGRRATLADAGSAADLSGVAGTAMAALRATVVPARSRTRRGAGQDLLGRALAALDRALAGLLTGDGPVVLVVPAALHTVPWRLVPSLAGRPVTVAPSARWWRAAAERAPRVAAGRAAVVAGPRLVEAEREAAAVAACYPRATLLGGGAATAAAVMAALGDAGVAHVACHGRIRHDNPLWSSLELDDGPLCVYDLERAGRTPPLVVLSGCETGVGVRAGDELLGLSTALLDHGTTSLVASVCVLPDSEATRDTMAALHRRVSRGERPAAALADLAGGTDGAEADEARRLLAASLTCFGIH